MNKSTPPAPMLFLVACVADPPITRPAGVERASFELRFATPSADGSSIVAGSPKGMRLTLDNEVLVSESDIAAVGTKEDRFKLCSVQLFLLTEQAGNRLREVTSRRLGQYAAFVVDGRVLVAAFVSMPLGNAVQISSGRFLPKRHAPCRAPCAIAVTARLTIRSSGQQGFALLPLSS